MTLTELVEKNPSKLYWLKTEASYNDPIFAEAFAYFRENIALLPEHISKIANTLKQCQNFVLVRTYTKPEPPYIRFELKLLEELEKEISDLYLITTELWKKIPGPQCDIILTDSEVFQLHPDTMELSPSPLSYEEGLAYFTKTQKRARTVTKALSCK